MYSYPQGQDSAQNQQTNTSLYVGSKLCFKAQMSLCAAVVNDMSISNVFKISGDTLTFYGSLWVSYRKYFHDEQNGPFYVLNLRACVYRGKLQSET